MVSHSRGGRESSIKNWESIKSYLRGEDDKSAEFSAMGIRMAGYDCYPHGFNKMLANEIIRIVRRDPGDGGSPKNVYVISERLMGMDLEDILSMSYAEARKKHNR